MIDQHGHYTKSRLRYKTNLFDLEHSLEERLVDTDDCIMLELVDVVPGDPQTGALVLLGVFWLYERRSGRVYNREN